MQSLAPETYLGRFKLISPLGKGGMGEVWKAEDERLSREVAIKILPPELANPDLKIRFERESKLLAALNHPNIAQIYEAGEEIPVLPTPGGGTGRIQFLVMEFIEGKSLSQILTSGPLPVLTTVRLGRQMARALGAAHKAGIIHRDLKPANIMVTSRNQVKILDFGLARPMERQGNLATLPDVTTSGMVLGTAAYLAPEQVKGDHADVRSDIWALGCVLYQMLAGHRPFPGDTIPEILAAVLRDEPEPLAGLNPGVPAPLVALVAKCLSKEPNLRPQSAFEISSSLKDIFQQMRPGGAASPAMVSSDSLVSGAVHADPRNIENANRFLKMADAAYPQFALKDSGPSAVEVRHRGIRIGILFCTKERDGGDILAFVSPLFPLPASNRPALYKRLLSLSNGHTDVAQFSIDRLAGMVNLACFRACDSMDQIQFQHTLDVMSETASSLAPPLRKEFGIQ